MNSDKMNSDKVNSNKRKSLIRSNKLLSKKLRDIKKIDDIDLTNFSDSINAYKIIGDDIYNRLEGLYKDIPTNDNITDPVISIIESNNVVLTSNLVKLNDDLGYIIENKNNINESYSNVIMDHNIEFNNNYSKLINIIDNNQIIQDIIFNIEHFKNHKEGFNNNIYSSRSYNLNGGNIFSSIGKTFKNLTKGFTTIIKNFGTIVSFITKLPKMIIDILKFVFTNIGKVFDFIIKKIIPVLIDFIQYLPTLLLHIVNYTKKILDLTFKFLANIHHVMFSMVLVFILMFIGIQLYFKLVFDLPQAIPPVYIAIGCGGLVVWSTIFKLEDMKALDNKIKTKIGKVVKIISGMFSSKKENFDVEDEMAHFGKLITTVLENPIKYLIYLAIILYVLKLVITAAVSFIAIKYAQYVAGKEMDKITQGLDQVLK
jgi:hypothetical protein